MYIPTWAVNAVIIFAFLGFWYSIFVVRTLRDDRKLIISLIVQRDWWEKAANLLSEALPPCADPGAVKLKLLEHMKERP